MFRPFTSASPNFFTATGLTELSISIALLTPLTPHRLARSGPHPTSMGRGFMVEMAGTFVSLTMARTMIWARAYANESAPSLPTRIFACFYADEILTYSCIMSILWACVLMSVANVGAMAGRCTPGWSISPTRWTKQEPTHSTTKASSTGPFLTRVR